MDAKYESQIPSALPGYASVMPNELPSYDESTDAPTILTNKQARLDALCIRHDINPMFKSMLWTLNEKHIIFLCDDSGSMNATVDNTMKTRWDELKHVVTEVLDISLIFDPIGMDVHFLNRKGLTNVRDVNKLVTHFRNSPTGGTPLVTKLTEISRIYQRSDYYKISKLLIIATDGEPTDDEHHYPGFKNIMRQLVDQGYHIAFLVCTDNESQVAYLNDIDRLYQQVDVTDDYLTEKRQIQGVQGRNFKFSYGDYIVKLLAGSFVNSLDSLDEHKLPVAKSRNKYNSTHNHIKCNIL
jgi:hypothetical protein